MPAFPWKQRFSQGADYVRPISFRDTTGVYTDLTGCSFRATLKADNTFASPTLATFVCTVIDRPAADPKNPDPTNRALLLFLPKESTEELAIGKYHFELWMTDAAGFDTDVFAGTWTLLERGAR